MKKRCKQCRKLLGGYNFNAQQRSKNGLASTCRACVNRRRRKLDRAQRRSGKASRLSLIAAARRGRIDVIKRRDPKHLHLLLWKTIQDIHSIKKGTEHIALARFLIRKGASLHWWMVCEAARGGNQQLVDLLLDGGVETNVFVAAAVGNDRILTELLDREVCLGKAIESHAGHDNVSTYNGITPLHCCAMSALGTENLQKHASLVRCAERLIQTGANVNARADVRGLPQLTPLHCSCWTGGSIELAHLLLKSGADPRGCLKFTLGHFQRHGSGNYGIAELLLATGADLRDELEDMLQRAANQGDAPAVRWLLAHGVNPNIKSKAGKTPLHFAAERNPGDKVIKLLIEYGADLNTRTVDGHTPLFLARLNNKRAAAKCLRQAGGL